jgi:hypothetical protein
MPDPAVLDSLADFICGDDGERYPKYRSSSDRDRRARYRRRHISVGEPEIDLEEGRMAAVAPET